MTSNCSPEARASLTLRLLAGMGNVSVRAMVEKHGSASAALESLSATQRHAGEPAAMQLAQAQLAQAQLAATEVLEDLSGTGARLLSPGDALYPERLLELHDPPATLYSLGTLDSAAAPAVAIVGTRRASEYGLRVAKAIASTCARAGISVISGLARGIDGAAHHAALGAQGRTTAVLGTGTDICYPRSHRTLQQRIAEQGLLLTEQPPHDPGHAGTFPQRNRIIAALADVVVVVEAGERSGALITANQALELGRTVACVPNAIDFPGARGSNALLKSHAEPVLSPDDVLALLDMKPLPPQQPALSGTAARCWDAIQTGARDAVSIAKHTGIPLREATATLALLEIDGLISFNPAGQVVPATLAGL